MINVPALFGCMVFNDEVMKQRLPKETYRSLHATIEAGSDLDPQVANIVANAMKDWAIEKGATHYTHWFQPLTGITAEKQDSFISPISDTAVIMEFSGKELIKGEPDASSFPSGGLRATFEARGYTVWDPTSYAFVKDATLYIPTAFCSYTGEVLDKKTPLLRSIEAINTQALRVLQFFPQGAGVTRVAPSVGPEQEYFLIDQELYAKRPDLMLTGRTLFGAKPPRGQELDDHYFGVIKPRVHQFMEELNLELWKLGILAKTQHNEVAPAQHELAPIFTSANVATDHNQITMELMKKIAQKHGFACLLHEKPFQGVNGSGKHNNWSLATNTGINLLKPGKDPANNKLFLLFLCAIIRAVDEHQDLLRISVTSAGNDHRLGGDEAPPAIVSMFLGSDFSEILDAIEAGKSRNSTERSRMNIGVHVLPDLKKDTTDRNRTSPFAFTGNKFEFRMLGSSASIATVNTVLNTITADVLSDFADQLESAKDVPAEIDAILRKTIHDHKRIIFNGDGYAEGWLTEAEKRGLLNLRSTPEALRCFASEKNIALFERHKVLSKIELRSRAEILFENYCKLVNIEGRTMVDIAKKKILPAVLHYTKEITEGLAAKRTIGLDLTQDAGVSLVEKLTLLTNRFVTCMDNLEETLTTVAQEQNIEEKANQFHVQVLPAMEALRTVADTLENNVGDTYWPMPTYEQMLFSL